MYNILLVGGAVCCTGGRCCTVQIGDEVLQGDGAVAAWCACDGALVEDAWVEHRMLGVMPQRKSGGVVPVYMYVCTPCPMHVHAVISRVC